VRRKLGVAVLVLGLAVIGWVGVVMVWGDPFTSLYTAHEQQVLRGQLAKERRTWARPAAPALLASQTTKTVNTAVLLRRRAAVYGRSLHDGAAMGRILIPRIGLKMIVVEGTTEGDLAKGPGHYNAESGVATALPGAGGVIGIAGHRTTFLQPFRHVDELKAGDFVYLEMPYGTFRYKIYYQKIVGSHDWSILNARPYEKLVLSACHPLYSATHRIVTYARLVGESTKSDL
jgi:sortase A